MANFLLVRHGTMDWAEDRTLHGITDIDKGQIEIKDTTQSLKECGGKKIYELN